MPKKSTKSKSKRTTLKQKYKVLKKVAEHHRKKRKELRKSGRKPKAPKDPGIPSQWPFKTELVKELEWEKQRAKAEQQRKRDERRLAQVMFLFPLASSTLLGSAPASCQALVHTHHRLRSRIAHCIRTLLMSEPCGKQ